MAARLCILAVVIVTFASVARNGFVTWDDPQTLYENPRMNPATIEGTLYYWSHGEMQLYIPMTYTLWSVIAHFSHSNVDGSTILLAWPFHLLSLAVHCGSTLIVFELLRRIVRQTTAAAIGAIVFAVHPLQAETIAWASGLKDVMCGMFCLLAIWLALQPQRWKNVGLATLAYAAACLSKPGAINGIPAAAIVLVILQVPVKEIAHRLAAWVAIAIVTIVIARHVQPLLVPIPGDSLWSRPFIAGDSLAFYLWKLVWPLGLVPDYGRNPATVVRHGWIAWTWVAPVVVALAINSARKQYPLLAAAALLFVAALLPMLGLVHFTFQHISTVADHYAYLAMLGPALAIAAALASSKRAATAAVALALLLLAIRCSQQVRYWHDNLTLFGHNVETVSYAPMAHVSYGVALGQAGRHTESIAQFTKALELAPSDTMARNDLSMAHANYGASLANNGNLPDAIAQFRWALDIWPGNQIARENLAQALKQTKSDH